MLAQRLRSCSSCGTTDVLGSCTAPRSFGSEVPILIVTYALHLLRMPGTMSHMIGKFIYRLFLTAFLVGFEIAIYLAVQVAYLRPAGDIYRAACEPNTTCAPFRPDVIALTAVQVAVGATIIIGVISLVMAVVKRPRKASGNKDKSATTPKVEEASDVEPELDDEA